jgi:hypothetical protein
MFGIAAASTAAGTAADAFSEETDPPSGPLEGHDREHTIHTHIPTR